MFIILLKKRVDFSSSCVDTMDFVTWFKDNFSLDKRGKITKSKEGKYSCGGCKLCISQVLCDPRGFLLETKDALTCLLMTKASSLWPFHNEINHIFTYWVFIFSSNMGNWKLLAMSLCPWLGMYQILQPPVMNEISNPVRSGFFHTVKFPSPWPPSK